MTAEELAPDPDERPYHPDAMLLVRAAEWVALEQERDALKARVAELECLLGDAYKALQLEEKP